jgi:phage terminase small subunit
VDRLHGRNWRIRTRELRRHMKGRKRTPTPVLRRRGSRIRQDRSREPRDPVGMPMIPAEILIDARARAHWDRLSDDLIARRILQPSHGWALALLSTTLADQDRLRSEHRKMDYASVLVDEQVDGQGRVHTRHRANPIEKALVRNSGLVLRMLAEFGLTPTSSSRVSTLPSPAEDPFEAFLRGPKLVDFPAPAGSSTPRRRARSRPSTDPAKTPDPPA